MAKVLNHAKIHNVDTSKLSFIFKNQPTLAWDMLEQECNLYTSPNIDVEQINKLTSFYCRIVIKLNELQDPRQKYFSNKMQKLMAQPFIIRTYTEVAQNKTTNSDLNHKRKELEQKLSIETEKQKNEAFQHIIQSQNQKEKKLKQKISQVIGQHQKNLQSRLQLRLMRKSIQSPIKKKSQDTIIHSSGTQFGNPEFMTPIKSLNQELGSLNLSNLKNKSCYSHENRPQSERIFNSRFEQTNSEISSDSEDEYRIQKILKQQKKVMAKKKQVQLFDSGSKKFKR